MSGTLTFTPWSGATLNLIGSFKEIEDHNKFLKPEIILGISADGSFITLHECFETESKMSIPGFLTSSFYANRIFVGAHFTKKEDVKFRQLDVHYSNLNEWVNIYGFKHQPPSDERGTAVSYAIPEPVEASLDNFKLSIVFKAKTSVKPEEVAIKQKTYIRIAYTEEKPLDECLKMIYHIGNFLTFAVGEPVYPLSVEGITKANKQKNNDKEFYPPVKIFQISPYLPRQPKTISPYNMFLPFKDISDVFRDVIKAWFGKMEQLEPVYDLYFGAFYNPHIYLQHQFSNLIQAVEAYHRRTMKNYELPEEEHAKRLEEIIKATPSEHKEWLKNKLAYSNEPTLRRRLKDIFGMLGILSKEIYSDEDQFISKVVDTRNYLTHHDEKLKEKAAQGQELYDLAKELEKLLKMCMLKELGFDQDQIKTLIYRNSAEPNKN
ncbi:MAG: hypothetical protein NZ826_07875 [Thermodesulfovibrio sp.]|nr:hypothetical protein [Thermodesulfovibrio sp.]